MNTMFMNSGTEFEAMLEAALLQRLAEATSPAGLEQRLKARMAQAEAGQRVAAQPFAFTQSVRTRWSPASLWTAIAVHIFVLFGVFVLASQVVVRPQPRYVSTVTSPPPVSPSVRSIGGGGGAYDQAPLTQGRLPKATTEQLVAPKAPPTIAPKLAVEPTVVMQEDLKIADHKMPNLGMPNARAATVGSLGTGAGGGIGAGNGNGVGLGSGGNMGGGIYTIGGGVHAPVVLSSVDPEFSEEARKQKFSGNVLVGLVVDEQGLPSHVRILRGVGMGLDERAVEAVRQYRFKPATKDGYPVKVELSIDVQFEIF